MSTPKARDDAQLVTETLAGSREAFAEIVERYKTLICSLAYSATGSFSESEDLAQDTFLAAWKQLSGLREPSRLRSWLCGIARHLISRRIAKQRQQPACCAEPIEVAERTPGGDPLPVDRIITQEQEAILWRCLSSIPQAYREPLVLYYREHRSVQQVATALDLREEAVKQRLSRGRRMLQEHVLAVIEGALERTVPGKTFTIGVLAALPLYTSSAASAAVIGTAVAKSSTGAKTAAWISLLCAGAGSLIVLLGTYIGYRASCAASESEGERYAFRRFYHALFGLIGGFVILSVPLMVFGGALIRTRPAVFSGCFVGIIAIFMAGLGLITLDLQRIGRRIARDQATMGEVTSERKGYEYRKGTLLGLPLIHIRIGGRSIGRREPVKAWVACGDVAVGGLFAFGGMATAPIALGGLSIGLLSWGGTALGLLAAGGFSLGWWSFGGCAVGWMSFGAYALGWKAAVGSVALAKEAALGWLAYATHFNDSAASSLIRELAFFRYGAVLSRHLGWINLAWIIPLTVWWRMLTRTRARRPDGAA